MQIRRELPADRSAILRLIHDAFAKDDTVPVEVGLTEKLFHDEGYIPELSLVAEIDGVVVGYVLGTRGFVGDVEAPGLGPLAVAPDHQGRGVGQALMHAVIGAAEALHQPFLALLGDPAYYRRFGFRPAAELGVQSPDPEWGSYFQGLALTDGPVNGTYRYAKPFDDL
jgi:putative acetyltransferase